MKIDLRQADNSGFPGVNHPWTDRQTDGQADATKCIISLNSRSITMLKMRKRVNDS